MREITNQTPESWIGVAQAFGRKAQVYDAFGQDHPNLSRMRAKVRAHVEAILPPKARLLEINAGTGADAAYFAERGYFVYATDLSAEMVVEIKKKIHLYGLEGQLSAQQISFTELDKLACGRFDGLLSNLGGINCASDLRAITRNLPELIKPGGVITWVVMPPVCIWELASAVRGDFRHAFRRLNPEGVQANVEGLPVPTYYYTPQQVLAAFGPEFKQLSLEGLSVFTPPADHKEFPGRHPRLYRLLVWLDDRLAMRYPFHCWGDFYILSLRYHPIEQR